MGEVASCQKSCANQCDSHEVNEGASIGQAHGRIAKAERVLDQRAEEIIGPGTASKRPGGFEEKNDSKDDLFVKGDPESARVEEDSDSYEEDECQRMQRGPGLAR